MSEREREKVRERRVSIIPVQSTGRLLSRSCSSFEEGVVAIPAWTVLL